MKLCFVEYYPNGNLIILSNTAISIHVYPNLPDTYEPQIRQWIAQYELGT